MTLHKLTDILESHGCDSSRWPEGDRQPCLNLIATDSQASALYDQYAALEKQLDHLQAPDFSGLEQRVLQQELPERTLKLSDRLVNWLLPSAGNNNYWRPALAACLPLVMGIMVGNYSSFGSTVSDDGFQYWEDELLMLSFNEYTETDPRP
ncbi:MAG: hypothetical protein RL839_16995 [Gammaproteobacteria bacterium]